MSLSFYLRNECGSLHPRAPICAFPARFFRDYADSNVPQVLSDFKRHISEFVDANRTRAALGNEALAKVLDILRIVVLEICPKGVHIGTC